MEQRTILQDLHAHGRWANQKLFELCKGLDDEQLDRRREMGFGSLRNTCFHILEAERLWLGRYAGDPWQGLTTEAGKTTIESIQSELESISVKRDELCNRLLRHDPAHTVSFQDLAKNSWEFSLDLLQLHVANHGTHHRAQVLSFLRQSNIRVPGGVDYLFYRIAFPSIELPEESIRPLRQYGLDVNQGRGPSVILDRRLLDAYLDYDVWATEEVIAVMEQLGESNLDKPIEMGMGSLRLNLQHMVDANRWWLANWKEDRSPFPRGEPQRSLKELSDLHSESVRNRNEFAMQLDQDQAARSVTVTAGGPDTRFSVLESLLQLACHGTHHRAQCLNMIRTLGGVPPAIDLIQWLRVGGCKLEKGNALES